MKQWKDKLGITASIVCGVHCAVTPIFIAFLPTLQLTNWMASPAFHKIAAVICALMVAISIWPMFRKTRDFRTLGLSTAGLLLIAAAAFALPDTCCSLSAPDSSQNVSTHSDTILNNDHAGHDHAGHDHAGQLDHSIMIRTESDTVKAGLGLGAWESGWLARVQPWMTPIGGCLLVLAHSLNLFYRSRKCDVMKCGCHAF